MRDLTTLERVRLWLATKDTAANPNALLSALIAAASEFVMREIQRDDLTWKSVTELYDGNNSSSLQLIQWPVTDVQSISLSSGVIDTQGSLSPRTNGILLTPPPPGGGPQKLTLLGNFFMYGQQNVGVTYNTGYRMAETTTASSGGITPSYVWLADHGVSYSAGASLEQVSSDPQLGQYSVSADGFYSFNAADEGQSIVLAYSYVPKDLEQAVVELVGERYRAKESIGQISKSVGGKETESFSQADMNAFITALLAPFKRKG